MTTTDLTKRINKSTDIVTQQNKQICNKIDDTEVDIKKHINAAERCILDAIDRIKINPEGDVVDIEVIDIESINGLF